MLLKLSIKDFAIIEELHFSLNDGITVITGETGAGKSILIDALSVLLGERASTTYIRRDKEEFQIEGSFSIKEMKGLQALLCEKGYLVGDTITLYRSFNKQGKTSILLNKQSIPLKVLKEISPYLAHIYGQYSNQDLLDVSKHHALLDKYNEVGLKAFLTYEEIYKRYRRVYTLLEELQTSSAEREREIDMLTYQVKEIEEAQLEIGEDEAIQEELKRFDNFDRLYKTTSGLYESLFEGNPPILDILNTMQKELKDLVRVDKELESISSTVASSYFELEDAAHSLSRYIDSISYDEERYAFCKQRDSLLYTLKKKYGTTVNDVIAFGEQARKRLDLLQSYTFDKASLIEEIQELEKKVYEARENLNEVRFANKELLLDELHKALSPLGLEKAKLDFSILISDELTSLGADEIELLFAPNQGEGFRSLAKIASGGELSRLALAFSPLINQQEKATLVFDEIDVGISGDVAIKVAEQIHRLAKNNQVLSITHMAQTVAIADYHIHLEKYEKEGRTYTGLVSLSGDEHIEQMAKMIAGDSPSEAAIRTAKDLIDSMSHV